MLPAEGLRVDEACTWRHRAADRGSVSSGRAAVLALPIRDHARMRGRGWPRRPVVAGYDVPGRAPSYNQSMSRAADLRRFLTARWAYLLDAAVALGLVAASMPAVNGVAGISGLVLVAPGRTVP